MPDMKLVDDAAMLLVKLQRVRNHELPNNGGSVEEQIDAVGEAVVKLALYSAERDGLRLTQP